MDTTQQARLDEINAALRKRGDGEIRGAERQALNAEVLQLCDAIRSVSDMVDQLAAKYAAPREAIATDVVGMLQDLADKGFLTEARENTP